MRRLETQLAQSYTLVADIVRDGRLRVIEIAAKPAGQIEHVTRFSQGSKKLSRT